MDNYNNEVDKKLNEVVKGKESSDKLLLSLEWVIVALSCIVLFMPIIFSELFPMENRQKILLILAGFIASFIGFCFALRIEQSAGYYECQKCRHRHIPTYKDVLLAPHIGRTRKLKCPDCGKKSWQKKVISKK